MNYFPMKCRLLLLLVQLSLATNTSLSNTHTPPHKANDLRAQYISMRLDDLHADESGSDTGFVPSKDSMWILLGIAGPIPKQILEKNNICNSSTEIVNYLQSSRVQLDFTNEYLESTQLLNQEANQEHQFILEFSEEKNKSILKAEVNFSQKSKRASASLKLSKGQAIVFGRKSKEHDMVEYVFIRPH